MATAGLSPRSVRRGTLWQWIALLAIAATTSTARAQVNDPRYADYFLVGRFGEICTMCEVTVLCEAGAADVPREAVPANGEFTLYYIQTRTFWSQIATIWEWFISNFDGLAVDGHERPVWIYQVSNGRWSGPDVVQARVSLDPPLIAMPGEAIERRYRRWQKPLGQDVGFCHRLPLWDTIEVINREAPGAKGS